MRSAINEEYAVIGIDIPAEESYWKIASLNNGIFPIIADDPKIEQFYRNAMYKGNIFATHDDYVYSLADIIVVDIGLSVNINHSGDKKALSYDVDMTSFEKGIKAISENCRPDVFDTN